MAAFEISVNGERRFVGDDVTAITLAADWVARRRVDRVSLHVGLGDAGNRLVQYLGADLGPGDEISIRVLSDAECEAADDTAPRDCSFCGSDVHQIRSLVAGPQVAICDSCLALFDGVLTRGSALPVGASIQDEGSTARCGFCQKGPPEVPGLIVRNAAALCPECLRACVDLAKSTNE